MMKAFWTKISPKAIAMPQASILFERISIVLSGRRRSGGRRFNPFGP